MPFTLSFDAASPAGLADLDVFIRGRSYVVGFSATQADVELFNAIGKAPDAAKFPNLARFYNHIASFAADARAKWPAAFSGKAGAAPAKAAAAAPAKAAAAPAKEEDDAENLFGDDDDDAAAKIAAKAKAAAAAAPAPKKAKKVVIDKSSLIYEVKPQEAGADMKAIETAVRGVEMDGLVWGSEFKIVDVAFGIQKLIAQAIIEDEKVSLYDLEEKLAACCPDLIQSVDQTSMSKIS